MAIDPKLLVIKPVNELAVEPNPLNGKVLIYSGGNELKIASLESIKDEVSSGIKGEAIPSTVPTPWTSGDPDLYEKYDVKTAGTYTNFKDSNNASIVVTDDDLEENLVQFWVTNGVAKKIITELPQAVSVELATDSEFRDKAADKAISAAQLFDIVIGDFEFAANIDLEMDKPEPDFSVTKSTDGLPGSVLYSPHDSLYEDMDFITSIDLNFLYLSPQNIYIFKRSDLTTAEETITITNPPSTGLKNFVFAEPINNKTHKIFFNVGFSYYAFNTAYPTTQQKGNGSATMNSASDLILGAKLYGYKISPDSTKKVNDRLDALENSKENEFTNNIYFKEKAGIDSIVGESVASTFSIGADGITITSAGSGNGVCLQKNTNLNERYLEVKIKFSADTIFYVGTQAVESAGGYAYAVVNSVTKKLEIYEGSTVTGSADIPFNIVNNRDYFIRLFKIDNITKLQFIDTVDPKFVTLELSVLGQYDKYRFGFVSSANPPVISKVAIKTILEERPFIVFGGDSITEGDSVGDITNPEYYHYRYANLIGDKLGQPYLVSGRSGGSLPGLFVRMQVELPKLLPKYFMIAIGTNGGGTEADYNVLIDYCISLGIIPILNLIPLYDSSTAAKNAVIQNVVNARNLLSVKMNLATSVNSDGVTKDNSLFVLEGGVYIHPNIAGNQRMFERALVDIPEIFSEVGKY